jgi:hypothetical protein
MNPSVMKIDWTTFATTKGRQVYASVLGMNHIPLNALNYGTGFVIGWDRWSDGDIAFIGRLFLP